MTRLSRPLTRLLALALLAVAAIALAGCGGGGGSTTGGTGATTTADAGEISDGGVLRFGLEATPNSLDPSQIIERSAIIVSQQFAEPLFEIAADGEPVPNIAAGYKTSADGKTMTIDLKKGVTFSSGDPVTSKDVAFSIDQARESPFNGSLYAAIAKVTAPAPDTVVLKLKTASPALLAALANYSAAIVPADYAGMSAKEFGQTPIGTGPYAVSSGERGRDIVLVANANFWKPEKPHFEEIVFTVATDENSRLQQVRGGDLDMTLATPIGAKTGLPPNSGVRIEETPQRVVNYFLLNQDDPRFEDPRVREAINLAIDRDGIIETATDGRGEQGASFLPPMVSFWNDTKPPAQDVAKAKQLIAEATKGGSIPPFTIRFYDFDAYSKLATQVIQQNLEEIGLTVKLQPLDESALNELLETGDYEAVVGIYYTLNVDPAGFTSFYLAFFAPGSGQNVDALNEVAEEAAAEVNQAKREQLYIQLQQMMIEEEGLLVLNYQPETYPVTERVTGVEFDGAGSMLLRNAGFTE